MRDGIRNRLRLWRPSTWKLHRDFSRPPRTGRQPEPGSGARLGALVLLAITEPAFSSQATVEQELSPAASMRWDEFLSFVNGHPQRRYRLEA